MAREAVRTLLAGQSSVEVVGEAASGEETVAAVRRLRPDLLFLDVQMPGGDGFAALEALGPDVPRGVVFVTAFSTSGCSTSGGTRQRSVSAGASTRLRTRSPKRASSMAR